MIIMNFSPKFQIISILLLNVCCLVSSVRYLITTHDDNIVAATVKKPTSIKAGAGFVSNPKNLEKLETANTNLFYIEENGDTHDMITDLGHHHISSLGHHDIIGSHGGSGGGYFMLAEKKNTKFLTEEISFVIAVVTLAVFLCFLSSVFIPLAILFFNSGGLLPFGGINSLFPTAANTMIAGGGVTGITGLGSMLTTMGKRRRRRKRFSSPFDYEKPLNNSNFETYLSHLFAALEKFN